MRGSIRDIHGFSVIGQNIYFDYMVCTVSVTTTTTTTAEHYREIGHDPSYRSAATNEKIRFIQPLYFGLFWANEQFTFYSPLIL